MYKLTNYQSVIRLIDNACIPFAEGNTDYQQYLVWLAEENIPEPADPIPTPDPAILRLQAYREITDPLFFKEQRGEIEVGTWLKAVEAIKLKYPYPVQEVGDGSN